MNQILLYAIVLLVGFIAITLVYILWVSKFKLFSDEQLINSQPYILMIFGASYLVFSIYISFFAFDKIFPENASFHGIYVDRIFIVTLIPTGIVFLITHILLFYFPYKFRASLNIGAAYIRNNLKLELIWSTIPLVTFIILFVWGQTVWAKMHSPSDKTLVIEVVAEQFNWFVRYPGKDGKLGAYNVKLIDSENDLGIDFRDKYSYDDFLPIQLHIPKNKKVKIIFRAKDVIHSFFIPHMKIKMDLVPGMPTSTNFMATVSTYQMRKIKNNPDFNYEIACAELCGRMHFAMKMILVVDEPEDYDKWFNSQVPWSEQHESYIEKMNAFTK
jgi:cytochrome c oxidase subunit 2